MHEELWAGVDLKQDHALFHFERMARSLEPPERTHHNVALEASGAIVGNLWQRPFYAHFDAFLSAARSIPEIIQCCFGEDRAPVMKDWFEDLPTEEQVRRQKFRKEFDAHYNAFRALPLSNARHVSEHRRGFPQVTVTISGLFGLTYIGSPAKPVPISEAPRIENLDPPFVARHIPLRPNFDDFDTEGEPLFPACQDYLKRASTLIEEARRVSLRVHGNDGLSLPPN